MEMEMYIKTKRQIGRDRKDGEGARKWPGH